MTINTETFFGSTIDGLKADPVNPSLIYQSIMTPIAPYYMCDYHLCNEPIDWNMPQSNSKDLREHIQTIEPYSIVFVQNNFFNDFVQNLLPSIHVKFILVTSQTHLPQLHISSNGDKVLENPFVIAWFSNNPVYQHPKYFPFPYGINNGVSAHNQPSDHKIKHYVTALLSDDNSKDLNIIHLPMRCTHPCRTNFPHIEHMNIEQYYSQIKRAKFLLSPIGDREDCYRHWEAIGLGTVPICNISEIFKPLFGNNMVYENCDQMIIQYQTKKELPYTCPNRDLICVSYWMSQFHNIIIQDLFGQNIEIEKKIHMSWKNKDIFCCSYNIIQHGIKKLRDLNSDYVLTIHDDNDVDVYLKNQLSEEDYTLIQPKHIVEKTDLWRLLKIYHEGGVYMDLDRLCNIPLSSVVKPQTRCVLPTYLDYDFSQDVMISCSKNKIIERAIELNLERRRNGESRLVYLGPNTYLHAISEILMGTQLERGKCHHEIVKLRERIQQKFPFMETFRENPPYSTVVYQGASIAFDKNEFYKSQQVGFHPA